MKTETAQQILAAARAEAQKMGKAVTIVVVDGSGAPVVLERLNGTAPMTTLVAEGKAGASVFTGRDSALLKAMAEARPSNCSLVMVAGSTRSTTATVIPWRAKATARVAPTRPPPTMATSAASGAPVGCEAGGVGVSIAQAYAIRSRDQGA